MLKVRNLERHRQNLVGLIDYAQKNEFILAEDNEFVNLFTNASQGSIPLPDLERLTSLTQVFVRPPVFTSIQAAAWLGVGIDTVRDAIWRYDPPRLRSFKPGHDVLITRAALWGFYAAYLNKEPIHNG